MYGKNVVIEGTNAFNVRKVPRDVSIPRKREQVRTGELKSSLRETFGESYVLDKNNWTKYIPQHSSA